MKKDYDIGTLKNCLKDILNPTWSSYLLDKVFEGLKGDMKEKQLYVLPIIDNILSSVDSKLTNAQFYFLKDIIIRNAYSKNRVVFSSLELGWLLERFEQKSTAQRATLIVMLLSPYDLSTETREQIQSLLKETKAESLSLV